jgi:hypothetical protein
MKKTLLTVALVAMSTVASFAQGSINPINTALTRVRIDNGDGVYASTDIAAKASDGVVVGIFWGAAGGAADILAGEMRIGTTDGVLTGAPAILGLQNAGDVGTIVSLEMRVISGGIGRTGVKQVTLAPAAGPGTIIWGSTATASRFSPLLVTVPEPSTIALGVLGLGSLLLFRRRK